MEQTRIESPKEKQAAPTLCAGDIGWTDYTVRVSARVLSAMEPCGFLFRYQTSLMHYGFFLVPGGAELVRINKLERTVLVSCDLDWDCDCFHDLTVTVKGNSITAGLDGNTVLECTDTQYETGCIALCACMPSQYASVTVSAETETVKALEAAALAKKQVIAKKQAEHPRPLLWKRIDLQDFGAGRQIRFGHLTGTGEMFFVICQHQRRVFKDRYPCISCMTAVSVESGQVLWQRGSPRDAEDVIHLTTDLPFQVYDIDHDGIDEVICSWDFKLMILDGKTGRVKREIPTPENTEAPETLTGIDFNRHAFKRLNVDAISIANVSGKKRPSDILIKDRYARIWIYDDELRPLWKFSHNNTGHFPYSFDFNNDGKDEIFSCYNMIDSSGKLLWKLPIKDDHTDEILFAEGILAIVSGWEGFMLADLGGKILFRDINGHAQRISTGNFCPERPGYEICTTTFWENQGIIYLYDGKGNEIWRREQRCNGNIISPVNWDGTGTDLILLNGNTTHGGMIDGSGDRVVNFPDDGHPELCAEVLDITGDCRDEIVLWDRKSLWIYTQDGPSPLSVCAPRKYPTYNASNYRGEYNIWQ
ncbi:hypothetical protein FACS1894110_02740 [Spirochaetia bacterium]|nr:hypothetical protein FACS1894110_02740 [Spirochaetia bacterium]